MKSYHRALKTSRYDNLISSHQHEDDPNFVRCLRAGCGSMQFHDPKKNDPRMICESCDYAICTNHQLPWHDGQTCREFDRVKAKARKKEEEASERALTRLSKKCPQCGIHIQKDGGCNHMTCKLPSNHCPRSDQCSNAQKAASAGLILIISPGVDILYEQHELTMKRYQMPHFFLLDLPPRTQRLSHWTQSGLSSFLGSARLMYIDDFS